MKKIIATIAVALLAVGCSPKLAFYNEAPYRTMQGKTTQVIETTYPATKQGKKNVLDKKSYEKFAYTYNKEGQLLTSSYTSVNSGDNKPNTSTTFTYSKGDLVKRVSTTLSKNKKNTTNTYERIQHSKNKDIFVEYSSTNAKVDTITVTYDYAKQEVIQHTVGDMGKPQTTTITLANYRKQQMLQHINNSKKAEFTTIYKYDDKGLLTNIINKWQNNPEHNMETKHTKFDSHNNWTECEVYANGKLLRVTEREIVYK